MGSLMRVSDNFSGTRSKIPPGFLPLVLGGRTPLPSLARAALGRPCSDLPLIYGFESTSCPTDMDGAFEILYGHYYNLKQELLKFKRELWAVRQTNFFGDSFKNPSGIFAARARPFPPIHGLQGLRNAPQKFCLAPATRLKTT